MDRVNAILACDEFRERLLTIRTHEKDRIYCHHDIDHLLAVARIMYIEVMERGLDIPRDIIYATALLHDIGRSVSDAHHDVESVNIAIHILGLAGYNYDEIDMITLAIGEHRGESSSVLSDLLYRADKMSRDCYLCDAVDTCKWKTKNKGIIR